MDAQAPRRSSTGLAFLAVLAIAGSAIGVMIYQLSQREKPAADASGFDLAQTPESHSAAGGQSAAPGPAQTQSGLGLLQTGGLGQLQFGAAGKTPRPADQKTEQDFTAAVRRAEAKAIALAQAYTARYPAIAQYGRDWMSYPDLKKLNDDYMRDHDPIAFLRGLARSQNFGRLMAKYAGTPAIQSFVKESITRAPGEVAMTSTSLLQEDSLIKSVVAHVVSALGLPPAMTAGILGGGKVDQNQVMGNIIQDNPGLQNLQQAGPSGR